MFWGLRAAPPIVQICPLHSSAARNFDPAKFLSATYGERKFCGSIFRAAEWGGGQICTIWGTALGFGLGFCSSAGIFENLRVLGGVPSVDFVKIPQELPKTRPNPRAAPPIVQICPLHSSAARNFDPAKFLSATYGERKFCGSIFRAAEWGGGQICTIWGTALGFGLGFCSSAGIFENLRVLGGVPSVTFVKIPQELPKTRPNPRAAPPIVQICPLHSSAARNFDPAKFLSALFGGLLQDVLVFPFLWV